MTCGIVNSTGVKSNVLGIRPFVPAKDFTNSIAFYEAIGFHAIHTDATVAILEQGGFRFLLQNFYVEAFAANCMVQLLVRDTDAWWAKLDIPALVSRFGVKAPIAPTLQHWGLKVGFVFDPSGVLWHIAEPPTP